ncbi:CDP-alcohol phosphatidyltransferase [Burkholderia territorii]|uniref:CDP-alcohol phosphatidyltransferase family protein n=1 Tax=Burkholderia territorii TaxID=1503055 RepID=UPI000753256A|nr:CDP-alcohol phosphatidyltransferase family protein [Burkholderia territorii]AOI62786.1 CDP-alcohol phosphatidyltransferase [Burkholderia territorii]KUY91064.1 CDP-alcohol phosphatidyltransferase [Burkholderia territorii]KUZ08539.1 CDP-alcohol phosphatidyltransferase [Burkholderia territorii]KVL32952.1 CDP-alcohol phosphatidyltransferase [Burkholderia territorii]KVL49915.1 CDP-alcohol phosphatidyltransferase [Burkholderia territorii]
MDQRKTATHSEPPLPRTWDARLARSLVRPLIDTPVTPNHLTTLRLLIGVAGAWCLAQGGFGWSNAGAFLIVLSNFVDHTDGELARISGKSSKIGHFYDLAADALVTVALFVSMGVGIVAQGGQMAASPVLLGAVAGAAVALIFFLRMRIESIAGKAGTKQAFAGGFETEDVLYLLPIVTLVDGVQPFLLAASIGAPLFAAWVVIDWWRIVRRSGVPHENAAQPQVFASSSGGLARSDRSGGAQSSTEIQASK